MQSSLVCEPISACQRFHVAESSYAIEHLVWQSNRYLGNAFSLQLVIPTPNRSVIQLRPLRVTCKSSEEISMRISAGAAAYAAEIRHVLCTSCLVESIVQCITCKSQADRSAADWLGSSELCSISTTMQCMMNIRNLSIVEQRSNS